MRIIKFRQPRFDSKGGFIDWFYWGFIDDGFVAPLRFNLPNYQFTGSFFKGRKLWQGEICEAEYRCAVCFDSAPHLLTGTIEQDDNGLWMFDYGHGAIPLDSEDLEITEVVGTVAENPDLLKNSKK